MLHKNELRCVRLVEKVREVALLTVAAMVAYTLTEVLQPLLIPDRRLMVL
jgi:hypothetical protein